MRGQSPLAAVDLPTVGMGIYFDELTCQILTRSLRPSHLPLVFSSLPILLRLMSHFLKRSGGYTRQIVGIQSQFASVMPLHQRRDQQLLCHETK